LQSVYEGFGGKNEKITDFLDRHGFSSQQEFDERMVIAPAAFPIAALILDIISKAS
jgi:hypothetical protein